MEDLHNVRRSRAGGGRQLTKQAGGVPTLLHMLRPLLHLDATTVTGGTLGEELSRCSPPFAQDVIKTLEDPLGETSSLVVLKGNLCPGRAIMKQSAMSKSLKVHRGKAVVFSSVADLADRLDDPNLEVDETSV